MLPQTRYESDDTKYDAIAKELIGTMADQVPMAMIWKPTYDVVMAKSITGFTTWYNYYPDFRDLARD